MTTFFRIALIALVFATLTACGAKGPLVLPEKAEPVEVPAKDAVDTPPVVPAVKPDGNG